MINCKKILVLFLIFIHINSLVTINYYPNFKVTAHAMEQINDPSIIHWQELWEDFEPDECKLPDFENWEYPEFIDRARSDQLLFYDNMPPVVKGAVGHEVKYYSNKLRLKFVLYVFLIYKTEEAAISIFNRKETGFIDQLEYTDFSVWEGYGLSSDYFLRSTTGGEYDLDANPPDVTPDTSLKFDDFYEMSLGPLTWTEEKTVTEGEGEEKREKQVFRKVGGHTEIIAERYKTAIIWNLGWTGVVTKWSEYYVEDINNDEIEVPKNEMNAQAREVIDSRVRILRFYPDSWFGWDSKIPLLVKVNVEEKLPLGGEIGLDSETRFGEWTWQIPRKPVKISLRMFRYDLKEEPSSKKWADLIRTYTWKDRHWPWEDPITQPIPKIKVLDKDEYCIIFDLCTWPLTEYNLIEIDTSDMGFANFYLDNGTMLREPLEEKDPINWYLDGDHFRDHFNPTIWLDDHNRYGDIGATIQAAAYHVSKKNKKIIFCESGLEQIKITHIAEVVSASKSGKNTWGVRISGYIDNGIWRQIKYYGDFDETIPETPVFGTEQYNPDGYPTRLHLMPFDKISLGRYDTIDIWFPLFCQRFMISGNAEAMKDKQYTDFIIYPTLKYPISTAKKVIMWGTAGIATIMTAPLWLKTGWYAVVTGTLVFLGTAAVTKEALDKYIPEELIWIDVTFEGTIIGMIFESDIVKLYIINGKIIIKDIEGNEVTLEENQMIKISREYPALSQIEYFDEESLPPVLESILTEDIYESETILDQWQVTESEPEPQPESTTAQEIGLVAHYPFNGDYQDHSGNGNHGTPKESMSFNSGKIGQGAYFDGKSWIEVDDSDSLDLSEAFTFSAWLNKEDAGSGGWSVIFSKADTSALDDRSPYCFAHTSDGLYPMVRLVRSNSYTNIGSGAKVGFEEWHLVTVTWNGRDLCFYIDGELKDTKSWEGTLPNSESKLEIGRDLPGYTEYFRGIMDDLRIYNHALSQSQISDLYNKIESVTSTPSPGPSSICAEGEAFFWSDFDEGSASGFGDEVGDWEVVQVSDSFAYTATTGTYRFSTAGNLNWRDYVVEADFINAKDGGLLLRAEDLDNCIVLIVRPSFGDIYWHVRKGGSWGAALERAALGHSSGEDLHVKVEVIGDTFRAYVDGELKTSLMSTEYPTDKIRLYLYYNADQYWDNVAVCSTGETEPVTPSETEKTTGTSLYIKDYGKPKGSKVSVPVYIEEAENLENMDFSMSFDGSVLEATGYEKGSLTSESLLEANIAADIITVAFTDLDGLNGDGTIIYIDFTVVGDEGDSCEITPDVKTANEVITHDSLIISTRSGTFTVRGLKGDANGDGRITAVDALMALKMAVGSIPVDMVCDMNGDGSVTSLDATLIREEAVSF